MVQGPSVIGEHIPMLNAFCQSSFPLLQKYVSASVFLPLLSSPLEGSHWEGGVYAQAVRCAGRRNLRHLT